MTRDEVLIAAELRSRMGGNSFNRCTSQPSSPR
jgi:hypothetical protein